MLPGVHIEIMRRALDGLVSARGLRAMIVANIWVDAPWNQFGRHQLHFDDNAFDASYAYIADERGRILPALEAGRPETGWKAFGRLTHTAQDFYSHTNYVDLWIACYPPDGVPPAAEIEPFKESLVNSPALHSGRPYLPLGLLSFIPLVGRLADAWLPRDAHAHMHLDSDSRGPLFEYALHAAIKRTRLEYDRLAEVLGPTLMARFRDLGD